MGNDQECGEGNDKATNIVKGKEDGFIHFRYIGECEGQLKAFNHVYEAHIHLYL